MPFIKIKSGKNKGKYRSPSGRIFTKKQVRLYYATEGFKIKNASVNRKRSLKKYKFSILPYI